MTSRDLSPTITGATPKSAANYTSGPWHAVGDAVFSGIHGQSIVADCDVGTKNWGSRRANAQLIALAPDLLAMLINLIELCDDVFVKPAECDDLIAAKAAVAKAPQASGEGE